MKTSEWWSRKLGAVAAILVAVCLGGCASVPAGGGKCEPVRKVDFKLAPQATDLAERARQTGNALYPAVCALLADGNTDFPPQFDICLKKKLLPSHDAEARITQICLRAQDVGHYQANPGALDQVLVHEMTHVAQYYYRPLLGRYVARSSNPPISWREGMADYVCFKLGVTNGSRCPECVSRFPHYRDGYSCAGAFLLYLEGTYNTNVVRQLHTVLRQGRYTDGFFRQATGKPLESLWAEFQRTPAFTPAAARMLELQQALGYVDGRPPKDIEQRLERFLEQHAGRHKREVMKRVALSGSPARDLQFRLALALYLTQPGGSAEEFLMGVAEEHKLPGFAKGEHGTLTVELNGVDVDVRFPATRSFTAAKRGDASTYHYTLYRASEANGWELRRAWRTDPAGKVVEELGGSVPTR